MSERLYASLHPRAVVSIQARMASTRLPGKVLAKVMGRPLLWYLGKRLQRVGSPLVIATSESESDDPIAIEAGHLPAYFVRGSELDPPARHLKVARNFGADFVAFLGADQVLVDPAHLDLAIGRIARGDCDYVRVVGLPHGLHVWAVTRAALEECVADPARDADEIEHTGAYWDRRPERYRTVDLDMSMTSDYRLTVDTPEDLELHRLILEALWPVKPMFTTQDLIALLDAHPDWAKINAHVSQYYWRGAPREGVKV